MKPRLFISLVVAVLAVMLTVLSLTGFSSTGESAQAEYRVQGLSCGSCVKNIQNALAEVPGVGPVEVSVTSGVAQVEYDPQKASAEAIGEKISAAGYPASLKQVLSGAEMASLQADASQLAAKYVGRIGERLISREDFDQRVALRDPGSSKAPALRKAVWNELLQNRLLLSAAEAAGVVVQDGEVELAIKNMGGGTEAFDAMVAQRFGSLENFSRRIKDDLIIKRTIEEHVVQGETDPAVRQFKVDNWYRNLVQQTPVTIYDAELKALVNSGGGGCGGGGCGGCG